MIRGIKFVGIPVRDQDAALKFYTEMLGFKVTTDQPFNDKQRWIEVKLPGAETGLAVRRVIRRGQAEVGVVLGRGRDIGDADRDLGKPVQ